jgi:hypothetical protein
MNASTRKTVSQLPGLAATSAIPCRLLKIFSDHGFSYDSSMSKRHTLNPKNTSAKANNMPISGRTPQLNTCDERILIAQHRAHAV